MMKKNILLAFVAFALCCACAKEQSVADSDRSSREFCLEAAPFEGDDPSVKSTFSDKEINRIYNSCILVYDVNGKYCRDISGYKSSSRMPLPDFSAYDGPFTLLLCANMGDVRDGSDRCGAPPSDIGDIASFSYVVSSYESMHECGFPMVKIVEEYMPEERNEYRLERLVGRYWLKLNCKSEKASYEVKSVVLKNAARRIWPFDAEGVHKPDDEASEIQKTADSLTSKDIQKLKRPTDSVAVYFLENLQGKLIDNPQRNPKLKNPAGVADKSLLGLLSHLEITADVLTPTQKYIGNRYRVYLGDNMYDNFSVRRNVSYRLRLNFESDMISGSGDGIDGGDWSVEPGELVDEAQLTASRTSLSVMNGIDGKVDFVLESLNGKSAGIQIVPASAEDEQKIRQNSIRWSVSTGGKTVGGKYVASASLSVGTDRPVEGLMPYACDIDSHREKLMFRIESFDGKVSKDFPVYLYYEALPLFLSMNPHSGQLSVFSNVDLYACGVSLKCKGELGNPFYSFLSSDNRFVDFEFTVSPNPDGGVSERNSWVNYGYEYKADQCQVAVLDISFEGTDLSVPYMGERTNSRLRLRRQQLFNNPAGWYVGHFHRIVITEGSQHGTVASCSRDVFFAEDSEGYLDYRNASEVAVGIMAGSTESGYENEVFLSFPFTGFNMHGQVIDYSKLNGCPFYFVNGGLDIYRVKYNMSKDGGTLQCYGYMNGRDFIQGSVNSFELFKQYDKGVGSHWWDTGQDLIALPGRCFMTINGKSTWIGADGTAGGFSLQ